MSSFIWTHALTDRRKLNIPRHTLYAGGIKTRPVARQDSLPDIARFVSGKFCDLDFDMTWVCVYVFVCVEVLRPSQPNGVMSSAVSLPNHTFPGQA